jgi:hypothetical protein
MIWRVVLLPFFLMKRIVLLLSNKASYFDTWQTVSVQFINWDTSNTNQTPPLTF